MHLPICLTSIALVSALPTSFDFIEDSYQKYATNNTDPCEDFYRHACPLGSPDSLIKYAFQKIVNELESNETFPANMFEFSKALNEFGENYFENLKNVENGTHFLIPVFRAVCNIDQDSSFLDMGTIFEEMGGVPTLELFQVKTCENWANAFEKVLSTVNPIILNELFSHLQNYNISFTKLREQANVAKSLIGLNLTKGILETMEIGVELLQLAKQRLSQTPWTQYHNVTEVIEKYTSQLHLYKDLEKDSVELEGLLITIERTYMQCRMRYEESEDTRLFCFVFTAMKKDLDVIEELEKFFTYHNAFNNHPMVYFGLPSYYHAQYAHEYASVLGFVGFIFGHELSHSFIEDHYKPKRIGFFSKKAQDCIQNQYDKTCKEYKEKDCLTADIMLDENGSDIFGMQLAYSLLEQNYGERMKSVIPRLGITNEQLFFYAFAYPFCFGTEADVFYGHEDPNDETSPKVLDEHASDNVRINAVAQHPGFKKAFNCPDDSRMMRSATEQCIVYGEGAPDTRKRH